MHPLDDTELSLVTPVAARPNFLPKDAEYILPSQMAERLRDQLDRRRDPFPRLALFSNDESDAMQAAAAIDAARQVGQQDGFDRGMRWGLVFGFLAGSIAVAVALFVGFHS